MFKEAYREFVHLPSALKAYSEMFLSLSIQTMNRLGIRTALPRTLLNADGIAHHSPHIARAVAKERQSRHIAHRSY